MPARSVAEPGPAPETEAAVAALYLRSPRTFERARDALAQQLEEVGDELGSARVRRLAVPTTAAWWVNQLADRWPDELNSLLTLGSQLREAAATRDRARLTELDRIRRVRTDALLSLLWHYGAEEDLTPPASGPVRPDRDESARTRHRKPSTEDLTLVLETVTAAVLDEAAAQLVRSGQVTRPLTGTDLSLLPARGREEQPMPVPVALPRAAQAPTSHPDALTVATAAVVDAENRVAAAAETVASLTSMLEGQDVELAELTRARRSTEARLVTWRRTLAETERELSAARERLDGLT